MLAVDLVEYLYSQFRKWGNQPRLLREPAAAAYGMVVAHRSKVMTTTNARPQIKKPANFDLKKGQAAAQKVIRENKEWLKEMADK